MLNQNGIEIADYSNSLKVQRLTNMQTSQLIIEILKWYKGNHNNDNLILNLK